MQKPLSGSRAGRARGGIEFHQRQREAVGKEGRNAADGADLALDVVERNVAFSGGIEFQDARNLETRLEFLPDVRLQTIAAAQPDAMRLLARTMRRVEEIAGEFADVLDECEPAVVRPRSAPSNMARQREYHASTLRRLRCLLSLPRIRNW